MKNNNKLFNWHKEIKLSMEDILHSLILNLCNWLILMMMIKRNNKINTNNKSSNSRKTTKYHLINSIMTTTLPSEKTITI